MEVGGKWQFNTGDDLAWAQPGYDDSGWEQLRGDDTWSHRHIRRMWGLRGTASGLR